MGGNRNLGKKIFLAKIGRHISSRYTKGFKNTTFLGYIFPIFIFLNISLKTIISYLWKYNGTPCIISIVFSKIWNHDFIWYLKKKIMGKFCIFVSFDILLRHIEASFSKKKCLLTKFLRSPIIKSFIFSYKL